MMIDSIEAIDRSIVLAVNSWNAPWLDHVMWVISAKATWVPFYFLLLFLFAKRYGWGRASIFLLVAIMCVALADQLSVHAFKNVFERYRPSHHALLTDKLHFYQIDDVNFYKGGMFGFVSSHAANFFAVCVFAFLSLKQSYKRVGWLVFSIAFIVCYSRMYLGVHYLSDLIGGAILGSLISILLYRFVFIRIIGKDYPEK